MIKQINGEHIINDYVAPASVAFAFNDVVTRNSAGKLALATASTPRSELLGLIQATIASTDSDYASDKSVAVLEFHDGAEFEADIEGTLTQAMVGLRFDLTDEDSVDVTANAQRAVEISRFISTTKGRVKFVTSGDKSRLVTYQQTVALADFTDGGSTTGTVDLGISIPAGAVFARSLVTAVTGFISDTSATLQIGDGTDVDRYSTGTPSVFTTASAGIDAGAPSGTLFHSTAKTPKLTITTNADFTSVTAGALTVTLFWYEAD